MQNGTNFDILSENLRCSSVFAVCSSVFSDFSPLLLLCPPLLDGLLIEPFQNICDLPNMGDPERELLAEDGAELVQLKRGQGT